MQNNLSKRPKTMAFKLPLHFTMLEEPRDDGRYVVEDILSVRRLDEATQLEQLVELEGNISSMPNEVESLNKTFDLAYAYMRVLDELPDKVRTQLCGVVTKALSDLCGVISAKTEEMESTSTAEVSFFRRKFKMFISLTSELARAGLKGALRSIDDSNQKDMVSGAGKKKSAHAAKKRKREAATIWINDCLLSLQTLNLALVIEFQRLWPGHKVEEELLNLFCRVGYDFLPHKLVLKSSLDFTDEVIQVIAKTNSRFSAATSTAITSELLPLLRDHEHLSDIVAKLVVRAGNEVASGSATTLASEMLAEIDHFEGQATLGSFVVELANQSPSMMLANVRTVLPLLNNGDNKDAHSMRSSVCAALGSVIIAFRESDFGPSDEEARSKTLDTFLTVLHDRRHDVSGYVRSSCVKVWLNLCKERAIPLEWLPRVAELAASRIRDKSSLVRRSSLLLLGELVVRNPFWKKLDPDYFEDKIADVADFLEEKGFDVAALDVLLLDPEDDGKDVVDEDQNENNEEKNEEETKDDNMDEEEEDEDEEEETEESASLVSAAVQKKTDLTPAEQQEVAKQLQSLKMYKRALEFIVLLGHCVPSVESLLKSKTLSDVVETLRFIRRTYAFGVPSICRLSRSMMVLAWSTKEEVKNELVATFQELYIAKPGTDGKERLPGEDVAKRLVVAVNELHDEDELASFEELMKLVVQSGTPTNENALMSSTAAKNKKKKQQRVISKTTIKTLWALANRCVSIEGSSDRDMIIVRASESAVKVLAMAASADSTLMASMDHVKTLGQIGFGPATRERGDWSLAQQACVALNCVPNAGFSSKRTNVNNSMKPIVDDIVTMISRSSTWKKESSEDNESQWYGAAQQGIHAIYHLSTRPEEPCESIVKLLSQQLFGQSKSNNNVQTNVPVDPLARFVFVLGEVAIGQLSHMERLAVATKKRRLKHEENGASENVLENSKSKKGKKKNKVQQDDEESEDEGLDAMMGNNDQEADKELEFYESVSHKLVTEGSDSLLSTYSPLIAQVARCLVTNTTDVATGSLLRLQEAISLTLCKFMCISEKFCESNLKLLFTALKRCPAPTVRCNIVVALGDLYSRFPNSLTPWSTHLFERLHDDSVSVRKSSLMVISHMILNGILKGRGQMAPVAACLEDSERKVADLANLFFHELSKRAGNPIYNLLPDTISQLSKDPTVTPTKFKSIFKFLLSFISKDAQTIALVGKLCQRFAESMDEQQWRDIAYCLTQLPYNIRCLRKIIEGFQFYKVQIQDDIVYDCFTQIVSKARKTNAKKPEVHDELEEWATKLERLNQGLPEEAPLDGEQPAVEGEEGGK